ncbi:hypothetical protein QYM36_007474 [Artemia franciscana]|uniref:Uncharacterized protein n=1 Tax=Artemia franciscana TaxID=6661 RepID=A0AA88ICF7_ARTSF|nr:hypothetical protein QYM36_007474 [Artemia franciscana]
MLDLNYNAAVANIKRNAEILNLLNPSEILNLLILFVDSNVEYAVIELLLKAGANPKYWFQVVDSNVEYANIELLVKVGANPKYRFQVPTYETELNQKKFFILKQVWGQTPLHVAVRNGRVDLCDLLILYGAEVDGINLNKETPLFTSIKANNSEMVKCLLENGANPNCAQCLHHAAQKGRADICRLLFSYGADLNTMF